jgi:hypothetical protein
MKLADCEARIVRNRQRLDRVFQWVFQFTPDIPFDDDLHSVFRSETSEE